MSFLKIILNCVYLPAILVLLAWEPTRLWTLVTMLTIVVYVAIRYRYRKPSPPSKATEQQIEEIDRLSADLYLDFEEALQEVLGEVRIPSQLSRDEADQVIRKLEHMKQERDHETDTLQQIP